MYSELDLNRDALVSVRLENSKSLSHVFHTWLEATTETKFDYQYPFIIIPSMDRLYINRATGMP